VDWYRAAISRAILLMEKGSEGEGSWGSLHGPIYQWVWETEKDVSRGEILRRRGGGRGARLDTANQVKKRRG